MKKSSSRHFIRRLTRPIISELKNMGYGEAIWLVQSNANFLLKCTFFVMIFLVFMVGEYLVVTHLHHFLRGKTTTEALIPNQQFPVAPPIFRAPDAYKASPSAPIYNNSDASSSSSVPVLLRQALWYIQQNQLDTAMTKVNLIIQASPDNPDGYVLRGHIYASQKRWDLAESDFKRVLAILGDNAQAKFNLAELNFMQNNYDAARPGFVALEKDVLVGDLATYKVFLCDLFGGHEDSAGKTLQQFNTVGANASYYFGNAAWDLYHHNTRDARDWLASAASIYSPEKFELYTTSLTQRGYLPLPPQL